LKLRNWLALLLLLIVCSGVVSASSVAQVTFDEMVQQSEIAFEGRVVEQHADVDANGVIHTSITFQVLDVLKGTYTDSTITLRYLGGTSGGTTLKISDIVLPAPNERGIYFVESLKRKLVHPLYGWDQGRFLVKGGCGQADCVFTSNSKPVVAFEQRSAKAAELSNGIAVGVMVADLDRPQQAMSVSDFKRKVRELSR
jgi:hypothetical protein